MKKRKYILLSALILSLTACAPRDTAMHTPEESYLHKELAEVRETPTYEVRGDIVTVRKSIEKVISKMSSKLNMVGEVLNLDEEIKEATEGGKLYLPVDGARLTSFYGYRNNKSHSGGTHSGIDLAIAGGTPIYAAHSGKVVGNYKDGSYGTFGNLIVIEGTHDGEDIQTWYAHMKSPSMLQVGAKVEKGKTILGHVGTTGGSTGDHLHFEVALNIPRTEIGKYITPSQLTVMKNEWWWSSPSQWSRVNPINYLAEFGTGTKINDVIKRQSSKPKATEE